MLKISPKLKMLIRIAIATMISTKVMPPWNFLALFSMLFNLEMLSDAVDRSDYRNCYEANHYSHEDHKHRLDKVREIFCKVIYFSFEHFRKIDERIREISAAFSHRYDLAQDIRE